MANKPKNYIPPENYETGELPTEASTYSRYPDSTRLKDEAFAAMRGRPVTKRDLTRFIETGEGLVVEKPAKK